jgi:prepilin-type N-terminal cleavage/methylation domain-containing protein
LSGGSSPGGDKARKGYSIRNQLILVGAMKMSKISSPGFTLVEMLITVAIIGLLAAIALPNFVHARTVSQANSCIENLRQMDAALQEFAFENKKMPSDTYVVRDLRPYMKTAQNRNPRCPAGGIYTPGENVTSAPTCSKGFEIPAHALP